MGAGSHWVRQVRLREFISEIPFIFPGSATCAIKFRIKELTHVTPELFSADTPEPGHKTQIEQPTHALCSTLRLYLKTTPQRAQRIALTYSMYHSTLRPNHHRSATPWPILSHRLRANSSPAAAQPRTLPLNSSPCARPSCCRTPTSPAAPSTISRIDGAAPPGKLAGSAA